MRDEKKSETLEVRLPYSQKIAFMDACKEEGITASEALRAGIDEFLETRSRQSQHSHAMKDVVTLMTRKKKTVGSLLALSLSAVAFTALPSAAADELFVQFDKNKDGVLTAGEISKNDGKVFDVLDKNGDGEISPDEFKREGQVSRVTDTIEQDETGEDVRIIAYELTQIQLTGAEEGKAEISVSKWAESVDMDADQAAVDAVIAEMKTNATDINDQVEFARVMGLTEGHEHGDGEHIVIERKIELDSANPEDMEELERLRELHDFGDIEPGDDVKIVIIRKEVHDKDVVVTEDVMPAPPEPPAAPEVE
ncbi:MAG: hypothetical protein CMK07_12270 [Ponticaulis sp.]|nr:hypothetical protein [Ponticaulis sp.]